MSTNRDQPRQRRGQPTGGQFAEKAKAASGLSLGAASTDGIEGPEAIAYSPTVTPDELDGLLDHSQPVHVRAAAARTPYPGVAERASYDPNPLVRALALEGWDLTEESRERLKRDPGVGDVLRALRD